MSTFKQLVESVQPSEQANTFSVVIEQSWLQGRTAFGGLTTALIVQAMLKNVPDDRRLRALSVSFVGPVPAGQHQIVIRPLREGGSVSHIQGEMICNGEVAASVNAAFGKGRESTLSVASPTLPIETKPYDQIATAPYVENVMPTFTKHFEMRFNKGHLPFSGGDKPNYDMWIRFKESGPVDVVSLIALGDVPPLPGFNMVKPPAMGSSLTWYLEFPNELPDAQINDWWFYDYRSQSAADGYFHNYATVWGPNNQAVMFSRQVAMVFEK